MDNVAFFLNTVDDLRSRLAAADQYSLIRAAALLRQLFLDGRTLIHAVNSDRIERIQLSFTVIPLWEPPPGIVPSWSSTNVYPVGYSKQSGLWKTFDSDRFLSVKCLSYGTNSFSIKQVIIYCANVKGGIHVGKPDGIQKVMVTLDELARIDGLEASLDAIRGIGAAVLAAIEPLVERLLAIKKKEADGSPS
jgi:hypothetical protein